MICYRRTAGSALSIMGAMAAMAAIGSPGMGTPLPSHDVINYAPPAFAKRERHKSKRRRSRFEIRGR